MKTTENISLAGYAFTIETDAYHELGTYLNDIKEAFASDPSAEEITTDIEARIAELLREKCMNGIVVDLSMIRDIRTRIGNPKELVQDNEDPDKGDTGVSAEKQKTCAKNKRLYRNIDERVLGGVCSGLGAYFNIDKVLFRILFLIFFILGFLGIDDGPFFGFSILAYLCLWIAMPAARTDEQKREMKRRPTSLDGYRSGDFNLSTEVKEAAQSPAVKVIERVGGVFIGITLLLFGLSGMIGYMVIPSVPRIISNEIAEEIADWRPLDAEEQFIADLLTRNDTFWVFILVIIGLMLIWAIYNGIMFLFSLKAPSWKPGLVIFISWLISIFALACYVAKVAADSIGTFFIHFNVL